EERHEVATEGLALTRREGFFIVAFWLLLALVTIANRVFDPRGGRSELTFWSVPVTTAFVESILWAVLTPAIFWLAARFSLERGRRLAHVALFLAAGIVAALLVSMAMDAFRSLAFPRPGRRGPHAPWWNLGRYWLLNDLIIYMGVLATGVARAYSLRYRARQAQAARLQAQLAEARLDALRRQLDPHFLFNTLHAISSLVERDPRGVRRMISRLSELLRYNMEGSHEPEIPLRQELDLLRRYLDIMQVRFQGRLEVETHVDGAALDALVPNMILQPLVENAIRHGIEKLVVPGRIEIAARVEGDALVLRVRDNGPDGAALAEGSAERAGGLGLRNTRARLEQLYGTAQRFTLTPAEAGGAVAEVRLPYHTRADLRTSELPTVPAAPEPSTPEPVLPPTVGTRRAS
ncbi:MAG TPA: histidine kinase, partial [Gemmatimonadaceae bacterium]|nr:histidine kinase [Gemmatimonadaceae bacterium]